jgi:hypothetical protein
MAVIINGTTGITAPGTEAFGDGTALGGATNPIVSMAKGANNYVQSYIVNNTAGVSSSADVVAYADNSTDSHGWVDMGFTSSAYADTTYTVTGPNEAYLFGSAPSGSGKTGNLVIATDNTGTANSIQFYTNGFTQAKSAAKMVIDGSTGNVGIGTSSPNYGGWSKAATGLASTTGGFGFEVATTDSTNGNNIGAVDYISTASTTAKELAAITATIVNGGSNPTNFGAYLRFLTKPDGGSLTERMRIDSSGNFILTAAGNINLNTLNTWSSGSNGYQKLPSGLIVQWGLATSSSTTSQNVNFPISFPNACLNVVTCQAVQTSHTYNACATALSTTGFCLRIGNGTDVDNCYWQAYGY